MVPECDRRFAAAVAHSLESGEEPDDSERNRFAFELSFAVLAFDTWLANGSEDDGVWRIVTMTSK